MNKLIKKRTWCGFLESWKQNESKNLCLAMERLLIVETHTDVKIKCILMTVNFLLIVWLKEVTKRPSPSSTVTPDQPIGRQQSCFAPQGSSSSLWLAGWNIFCPDDNWTLSVYSFLFRLFPLCNWIHIWELDVSMLAWCPSRTEHTTFVSSYHVW